MELDPAYVRYCEQYSSGNSSILSEVEKYTRLYTPNPYDSSGFIQGRLLSFLSFLVNPRLVVEVGTFTAYGTICLATGLSQDGRILTIESKPELEPVILNHLNLAGLSDNVDLRIGDAKEILQTIEELVDLAFLDGAKMEYRLYYDILIERLRPGGLMIVDNVLWKGKVISNEKDKVAQYLHDFNDYVNNDCRNENIILPFRDGLSLIRKL